MTPTAPRRRACPLKISPIIAVSARPLSRDDQNLARPDPVDGQENGPEVGRLAQRRDRASKQAGLPSGRQERPDRWINLPVRAPDIDRNGDGYIAPAFDLGVGQIARGDRVNSDGQGYSLGSMRPDEIRRDGGEIADAGQRHGLVKLGRQNVDCVSHSLLAGSRQAP